MFEQLLSGIHHLLVYFMGQFLLELFKREADLFWLSAVLIYLFDSPLQVHTAFDGTQHFIRGTEYAIEKVEFLV